MISHPSDKEPIESVWKEEANTLKLLGASEVDQSDLPLQLFLAAVPPSSLRDVGRTSDIPANRPSV